MRVPVGVRVSGDDPYREAEFVLYAGGWADVDYVAADGSEVISEHVELDDVDEFGPLLDRVVVRLVTPGDGPATN